MINLLIADDESIFRSGLKTLIENEYGDVTVFEAENGLDALGIIERSNIDGMFLDINMPRMDGLELLEMLKEKNHKIIPTIIVSGFNDFEYARRAIRTGVCDYLLKPLTPAEAGENVKKLLCRINENQAIEEVTKEVIKEKPIDDSYEELGNTKNLSKLSDGIIKYIANHYKEDFSIGKIADELKYNSNYISQVFKNDTGIKLNDYIRNYRIEEAKALLRNSENKITDIAHEVGIPNTQYFSTVFKAVVGCTPQEYREKSNKKIKN